MKWNNESNLKKSLFYAFEVCFHFWLIPQFLVTHHVISNFYTFINTHALLKSIIMNTDHNRGTVPQYQTSGTNVSAGFTSSLGLNFNLQDKATFLKALKELSSIRDKNRHAGLKDVVSIIHSLTLYKKGRGRGWWKREFTNSFLKFTLFL